MGKVWGKIGTWMLRTRRLTCIAPLHHLSMYCRDPMPAEKKMMQMACGEMAGKAASSV